jgi:hypothetical protein
MKSPTTESSSKKETKKPYGEAIIKKLPDSQIEIVGHVPAEIFDSHRKKALENINKTVKIDGFRDGNAPENTLVSKVGEKTILEEMAELALSNAYPAIIIDNNIDPISRPEISITKMAMGNPLEFIIKTAVTPEVKLGDYKKIAATVPAHPAKDNDVSEKEVDEALARIRKSHDDEHTAGDHAGHEHGHEGHDHSSFESPEFKKKIITPDPDPERATQNGGAIHRRHETHGHDTRGLSCPHKKDHRRNPQRMETSGRKESKTTAHIEQDRRH